MTSPNNPSPSPKHQILKGIPPFRITWIGICLAVLLWFGSSAYFQKTYQISKIEYQTGDISETEYDALLRRNARYALGCKVAAGIICLASCLYLISQSDIHRPRN